MILLGASGCGKTTLLSVSPHPHADLRTVKIGGQEVVGLKGAALTEYRRNTVGVVFQAFNLVPVVERDRERDGAVARRRVCRAKIAKARAEELLERGRPWRSHTTGPVACRAVSSSASRSRGRSRTTRR